MEAGLNDQMILIMAKSWQAAGHEETFTKEKYSKWEKGVHVPSFSWFDRSLRDQEAKGDVGRLAVSLLRFGEVNQGKDLQVRGIEIEWDEKRYTVTATVSLGTGKKGHVPYVNMDFRVEAVHGEVLNPDSKVGIPSVLSLDSDGQRVNLCSTEASESIFEHWNDSSVRIYLGKLIDAVDKNALAEGILIKNEREVRLNGDYQDVVGVKRPYNSPYKLAPYKWDKRASI